MKRVVDFVIKSELHIFNLFITTLECVEMDQLSRTAMVKRSRMVERIVKAQKKKINHI